jgi:L-asparaginase
MCHAACGRERLPGAERGGVAVTEHARVRGHHLLVARDGLRVPLGRPVREAMAAVRAALAKASFGAHAPVALLWMGLDETGRLIEAMLAAPDRLGYRGAVIGASGGGHVSEASVGIVTGLAKEMPTVVATRAGAGGPMLRQTYGGPSSEIALRKAGLIWGGRLHPLKVRVLLETCLRAGLAQTVIAEIFDAFG